MPKKRPTKKQGNIKQLARQLFEKQLSLDEVYEQLKPLGATKKLLRGYEYEHRRALARDGMAPLDSPPEPSGGPSPAAPGEDAPEDEDGAASDEASDDAAAPDGEDEGTAPPEGKRAGLFPPSGARAYVDTRTGLTTLTIRVPLRVVDAYFALKRETGDGGSDFGDFVTSIVDAVWPSLDPTGATMAAYRGNADRYRGNADRRSVNGQHPGGDTRAPRGGADAESVLT